MSLIFFDLEGTLTDKNRQLPHSVILAIQQLHDQGHKAFLSTGCSLALIPESIRRLALDGIIAAGGASIHTPDHTIREWLIDEQILRQILPLLDSGPIDAWLEGPEYVYVSALEGNPYIERLIAYLQLPKTKCRSWHEGNVKANKVTYQVHGTRGYSSIRQELIRHFDLIERPGGIGEAVPKGFDKGEGICRLIQYFGWENQVTYAFGDSENDASMLRKVDHPIAMESGAESLKALAETIAPPPENDGIYHTLRQLHLIRS